MDNLLEKLGNNISTMGIADYIDIMIVAFVIYNIFKFVRDTRASQLVKGIGVLMVFMYIAELLKMKTVSFILETTFEIGLIAIIIVFQPELRKVLEKVGTSTLKNIIRIGDDDSEENNIGEVCTAVSKLAASKTGALILIERNTKLGDIISTGTVINSTISHPLLINLFVPNTPLHDGAVVIGDNRIKAAACFLPLTQNNSFSKEMGTRHRAAIGVSEITDCIAIVVSEETGTISMAINGDIKRDYTPAMLKRDINEILENDKPVDKKERKFNFGGKKK